MMYVVTRQVQMIMPAELQGYWSWLACSTCQKLHYRIDLVAFSLEEPPYFRTDSMGSYIHAQSLVGERIFGMISLEMIAILQ
jgi:hypothetical protein